MSTLVQIKRSTSNVSPASLLEGELAYSYVSNTLFIGDTANAAINIGGNYYTTILDNRTAANSANTLVVRYANGTAQFAQLDILTSPTANSHVATKEYVDTAVVANVTLASLNDVDIGTAFSDQNNKILIGNSAGYYVGTNVTGNVSLSNTGVFTIGAGQVTNAMLVNSNVAVTAGAGLGGGGTVNLGSTITLDVIAGDGISNANSDTVSVDTTVVRTDRNQTVNGVLTFANTTYFNQDINVTGNIYLNGNTTYINVATLNISDPLIYLAANNDLSDSVDIGFMGGKNTSGTYSHTGLIRHAADGNWYLFDGLIDEGHQNNIVDVANTTYALLKANLEAQSLNVKTGFANVDTTLTVTGNTSLLSNVSVSKNLAVTQNLTVTEFTNSNTFVSTKTALAAPNTSHFDGERLRLFDFGQAGHPNYAIGVEPNHIWTGVDDNTGATGFKWYGNTSLAMILYSNGVLNVVNTVMTQTLNVTSSATIASLTLGSALGVGSGGTGLTSFTANGVFFADTSSTLSFATGTEGEVLQITSGVPTFGMLDGGSF